MTKSYHDQISEVNNQLDEMQKNGSIKTVEDANNYLKDYISKNPDTDPRLVKFLNEEITKSADKNFNLDVMKDDLYKRLGSIEFNTEGDRIRLKNETDEHYNDRVKGFKEFEYNQANNTVDTISSMKDEDVSKYSYAAKMDAMRDIIIGFNADDNQINADEYKKILSTAKKLGLEMTPRNADGKYDDIIVGKEGANYFPVTFSDDKIGKNDKGGNTLG